MCILEFSATFTFVSIMFCMLHHKSYVVVVIVWSSLIWGFLCITPGWFLVLRILLFFYLSKTTLLLQNFHPAAVNLYAMRLMINTVTSGGYAHRPRPLSVTSGCSFVTLHSTYNIHRSQVSPAAVCSASGGYTCSTMQPNPYDLNQSK